MLCAHILQLGVNRDVTHDVEELPFTSVVVLALDTPQVFVPFSCMPSMSFLTRELRRLEIPHIGDLGLPCVRDEIAGDICINLRALHQGIPSTLSHSRLFKC